MGLIDAIRERIRAGMRQLARLLDLITGGRLHPDAVTITGALLHIPVALLIASGDHTVLAALLLAVFGLLDTLDGELARLQHRASPRGMLLDASTDRIKEVLLYTGVAYALATGAHPATATWAAAACGASLCVSYVKAKGEAAVAAGKSMSHAALNKLFKDGLLTFELRVVVLVIGLLTGGLAIAAAVIAILAAYTALQRLVRISGELGNV